MLSYFGSLQGTLCGVKPPNRKAISLQKKREDVSPIHAARQRKGWTSKEGLGRHRMTSIVFCYLDCPSGGTVEYMCDSDYLTDEWEPHLWDPGFANHHWLAQGETHNPAEQGDFRKLPKPLPSFSEASKLPL